MATMTETRRASSFSSVQSAGALIRRYFANRKVLAVLALLSVGAGFAFNWSWLVAAGIAPIVLALAPCAAMCALGICMMNKDGKACSSDKGKPAQGGDNAKGGQ